MDFIESPDGLLLKANGSVNLLGRAIAMSAVLEAIEDEIICKLPYQHWLYIISTNGKEFTQ